MNQMDTEGVCGISGMGIVVRRRNDEPVAQAVVYRRADLQPRVSGEEATRRCLGRVHLPEGTIATSKESFTSRSCPLTLDVTGELALIMQRYRRRC